VVAVVVEAGTGIDILFARKVRGRLLRSGAMLEDFNCLTKPSLLD
jgi:hypothetical protein